MRKISILMMLTCLVLTAYAQPRAYKGGNHTGVYGVFENPASIVANPRKWDVNLFSVGGLVANDQVEIGLKNLNKDFEEELFGGEGKTISGLINAEVIGPSFLFKIGNKNAFALTTRARVFGNIGTLDTRFAESISSVESLTPNDLPYRLVTGNQKITTNAWSEIGVSYGRVLFSEGKHKLSGGVTLKYIQGAGNAFVNIQDLKGDLNADFNQSQHNVKPYLTNASGSLQLVSSGVDLFGDNFETSDLTKSNGSGVGFDVGFTYEYKEDDSPYYKFKAGVSVLDIGSVSYETNAENAYNYTLNVPQGSKFYLDGLSGSINEMQKYLDNSPYATKKAVNESYKPSLPTMLNLTVDYCWSKHFYTEVSGNLSLVSEDEKIENPYYYSGVAITPRFEGKYIGVYAPINYNKLTEMNVGLSLRLGPVFVGSGSIVSSLLSENKQADVFVGLRFGL